MDYPLLDAPPADAGVTEYDLAHASHYLRLLDAAAEKADWRESGDAGARTGLRRCARACAARPRHAPGTCALDDPGGLQAPADEP